MTTPGDGVNGAPSGPQKISSIIRFKLRKPDFKSWSQSQWVVNIGAAVIGGLILAAISAAIAHFTQSSPPAPTPDVAVEGVTVTPASVTPPRPEAVEFKLLNTGNQTAVLTQAGVQVQQFTVLYAALPNAAHLSPDFSYGVPMPLEPRIGKVIPVQLSESAGPDSTDDFTLDFHLPPVPQGPIYLYRVSISLLYGKETKPVEVLISLPNDPGSRYSCPSNNNSSFCDLLRNSVYRSTTINHLLSG